MLNQDYYCHLENPNPPGFDLESLYSYGPFEFGSDVTEEIDQSIRDLANWQSIVCRYPVVGDGRGEMMAHTPGPWLARLAPNEHHGEIIADVCGDIRVIAKFETRVGQIGEGEANCRLATIAPDLLENSELLCKELCDAFLEMATEGAGRINIEVIRRKRDRLLAFIAMAKDN